MVKKGRGRHFPPKLRGSEIWLKHVPDTVPTSNVDQFLSLMAEIVPLDVNSNFVFMVECSRITLDDRKWAGKRFCPETLGWAKWGSWPLNFRPNPGEPNLWISKRYFLGWFSIQFCLELEGLLSFFGQLTHSSVYIEYQNISSILECLKNQSHACQVWKLRP